MTKAKAITLLMFARCREDVTLGCGFDALDAALGVNSNYADRFEFLREVARGELETLLEKVL